MKIYEENGIRIVISVDAGYEHLSISRKDRNPTWEEIKKSRYKYLDKDKFYVMVLPPEEFYVNIHPYCFHLWEVKSKPEIDIWSGM